MLEPSSAGHELYEMLYCSSMHLYDNYVYNIYYYNYYYNFISLLSCNILMLKKTKEVLMITRLVVKIGLKGQW